MENELRVSIVNAQKIIRGETGEIITKVCYMTSLEQTDKFYGYTVLEAWCNGEAFEKLRPYLGKEVKATIGVRKGKNAGLTAYLKKIDNIAI